MGKIKETFLNNIPSGVDIDAYPEDAFIDDDMTLSFSDEYMDEMEHHYVNECGEIVAYKRKDIYGKN